MAVTTGSEGAEFDRIHRYLSSQGEKYAFDELWRRVVGARLELLDALDGVTDEQARFQPSAADWSIREIARHILRGSRGCRGLVEQLSAGAVPDAAGPGIFDPPREATDEPITALREELLRDGVQWCATIADLPPRPPTEPTAPHSMFGELHARAWYLFERVHDLDHANQIRAVQAAPGYPA